MCYLPPSHLFGSVLLLEQSLSSFRARYFFFYERNSVVCTEGEGREKMRRRREKMSYFHSLSSFSSYFGNLYYECCKEGDVERDTYFSLCSYTTHIFVQEPYVVRRDWEYNSENFGVYSLDSACRHASLGARYPKAVWDCISQEPSTVVQRLFPVHWLILSIY